MNYCILDDIGDITNIIICDSAEAAQELGAVPGYAGAMIGACYAPPPLPPPAPSAEERIAALEEALCEQDDATAQRLTAIELALCELDSVKNGG